GRRRPSRHRRRLLGATTPGRRRGASPFRARTGDGGRPITKGVGLTMAMPLRQSLRLGGYLLKQKLLRRGKFALLLELEPLYACNLKCAGCGKIQHPADLLKQRMPVDRALAAVDECGAPMVSIAGGEPLMHPQIDEI